MTDELNGGCLDEREAFEAYMQEKFGKRPVLWDGAAPDLPEHLNGRYILSSVQTAWEAFQAGRASLSTSKQAGAEPVAIINGEDATALSLLDALIDIYDDTENKAPEHRCYVEGAWEECLSEARAFLAAPGAAIAAREQEALPEPVMLSLFEGGEKTWPHYFDLKVGQRVRVHTGEEGRIETILRGTKKYHVLIRPDYGGTYGAWEVTPLASREEAPATPQAAIPAAPSEVTDAQIIEWAIEEQFLLFCDEEDVIQIVRSAFQKWPTLAALTQPTTVQQAEPSSAMLREALEEMLSEAETHCRSPYCDINFEEELLNKARRALKTAQTTALNGDKEAA